MALFTRRHEDICLLLISLLYITPLTVSINDDCNGKSFHCVNSTHFTICVDVGGGVSMTVDNFVIQCPPTTICLSTNNFECEYQESTTQIGLNKSEATNDPTFLNVISLVEASSEIPSLSEDGITSVLPLDKYFISSKPSQISENDTKKASPEAVSNKIKKDVMTKMEQTESPNSYSVNILGLDKNIKNNNQPTYTEPKNDLVRFQNNRESIVDSNFTDVPPAKNAHKVVTNRNITEDNKQPTATEISPQLQNMKTIDMFIQGPKINYNYSDSTSDVLTSSNNGEPLSSAYMTNDTIINENDKVPGDQNTESENLFLNRTLPNALPNVTKLEYINDNENISSYTNNNASNEQYPKYDKLSISSILSNELINSTRLDNMSSKNNIDRSFNEKINNFENNQDLSAPIKVTNSSTLLNASVNVKNMITFPDYPNITGMEKKYENKTYNNGNFNFLNISTNTNINPNINATEKQSHNYENFSHISTLSDESINNTRFDNVRSHNGGLSVYGNFNNFVNNEGQAIPNPLGNSSFQFTATNNSKSEIIFPKKAINSSNINSDIETQIENKTENGGNFYSLNKSTNLNKTNINGTEKQYFKYDNLSPNNSLSNELVNNTRLDNVSSQNINNEVPTVPTQFPDQPEITVGNNFDMENQYEKKTNNNGNINFLNITKTTNIDANITAKEKQFSNFSLNSILSNEPTNNTRLEHVENGDPSIDGNHKNLANKEGPTVQQLTVTNNAKFEIMFPNKAINSSNNDSYIETQIKNITEFDGNFYSLNKSSHLNETNINATKKQYFTNDILSLNNSLSNELVNNMRLENASSQDIDLSVNQKNNTFGNNEVPTVPIQFPNQPKLTAGNNFDVEKQFENKVHNNGNNNSVNHTSTSTNINSNINATEKRTPNYDNFYLNSTLSNESINNTRLDNVRSQNENLSVDGNFNNFVKNEVLTEPIGLGNSSFQSTASENVKPTIFFPDKAKNTDNNNSDMEFQIQNTTENDQNINSLNISSNANIDTNIQAAEKRFPKYNNFSLNSTLSNESVNNTGLEYVENEGLNVDENFNDFVANEGPTEFIRLGNSSFQLMATNNSKSEIMLPNKAINSSNNDPDKEMQIENKTESDGHFYSLNTSTNLNDANKNTTEKQHLKYDNLALNNNLSNGLVDNTRLENVSSQNIELSVNQKNNTFGNNEVPPHTFGNIEVETVPIQFLDQSKFTVGNNFEPEKQYENKVYNNGNINFLNITTDPNIDANITAKEKEFSKYDNISLNSTSSNEFFNNTESFVVKNSSAHLSASENTKPEIVLPEKQKSTSYNISDKDMRVKNKIDDNGDTYLLNISSNANINDTTDKWYHKFDNLSLNNNFSHELINNTWLENVRSLTNDQNVDRKFNNIGNNESTTTHIQIGNSSFQLTSSDNVKPTKLFSDEIKSTNNDTSDIVIQLQNKTENDENNYSLNASSNAKIDTNMQATEKQFSKHDNFSLNSTLSNELFNNTRLENVSNQNIDLSSFSKFNNFGNYTGPTAPIQLCNSSSQLTTSENEKPAITFLDKANITSNNNSDMEMQLENKTKNDGNVYSLNISLNSNINATENRYHDYDDLPLNKILSNEPLDKSAPIEVTNSVAHLPDFEKKMSYVKFSNQPNATSIINSDMEMQSQNKTGNNGNINLLNIRSNANIDAKATEKRFPKYDNFTYNSNLSNELLNNTRVNNISSQNRDFSVDENFNNFVNNKSISMPIRLGQSPFQLMATDNAKSKTMFPDKSTNISNDNFAIEIQIDNKTENNGNVYLLNIASNENINATIKQYSQYDDLFFNTSSSNKLFNNTKLENVSRQNIDLNGNPKTNNFGNNEGLTVPTHLRNSTSQLMTSENKKSAIMYQDKANITRNYNSDMDMQLENKTYNNGNMYSLNNSANANIDTAMAHYTKYEKLSPNTTLSSELIDKISPIEITNLSAHLPAFKRKEPGMTFSDIPNATYNVNSDLEVQLQNEAENDIYSLNVSSNASFEANINETRKQYTKYNNLSLNSTLWNDSVNKTAPIEVMNAFENTKSEIEFLTKFNNTNHNISDMELRLENKPDNNESINSLNISLNVTENRFKKYDNLSLKNTSLIELVKNTSIENLSSQNRDQSVDEKFNSFVNNEGPNLHNPLENSSYQLTVSDNVKPDITFLDQAKITSINNADLAMQIENKTENNGNFYLSNINSNTNININASTTTEQTEKQHRKYDNLSLNSTLSNKLFNKTAPIDVTNSSTHLPAPKKKMPEIIFSDNSKATINNNSDIKTPLENKTENNESINSLYISSNANSDPNINETEEQYPNYNNLSFNTDLPHKNLVIVKNGRLENVSIQNRDLSVDRKFSKFGTHEVPTTIMPIQSSSSSSQSTMTKNEKPTIMIPDENYFRSSIVTQMENMAENNASIYVLTKISINSNNKFDANNTTEQYSDNDKSFVNTTLLSEYNNSHYNNTESPNLIVNGEFDNNVNKNPIEITPLQIMGPKTLPEDTTKVTGIIHSKTETRLDDANNNKNMSLFPLVDKYAIMNNETLPNSTTDDEYVDGVEIFNTNFGVPSDNGTQSASSIIISHIESQGNKNYTHENYITESNQSDIIYNKYNIPTTNTITTILYDTAATADGNYSRKEQVVLNNTRGITNTSINNDVEITTQSISEKKSSSNIYSDILHKTENYFKASPTTIISLNNSETIINETVRNNSWEMVNNKDDNNKIQENITTDNSKYTRINKFNNNVLTDIINSTESTIELLTTAEKPVSASLDMNSFDFEITTQTVLVKLNTSSEIFNFTKENEGKYFSTKSLRTENRKLGNVKFETQNNCSGRPNCQDQNVSHIDNVNNSKVLDSSVNTTVPYTPVTIVTKEYYTQVETSTITADHIGEKQIVHKATEKNNLLLLTSIGDESKKNINIISNKKKEIVFDDDTSTVSEMHNISKPIDINIKTSIAGNQHLVVKPRLPAVSRRETNNYTSEMKYNVRIIHKNETFLVTTIKSLPLSSEIPNRNLSRYDKIIATKFKKSMVSNVNTKVLPRNGTKAVTSSNKELEAKLVKENTDILKIYNALNKFSTQTYTVPHGNTYSKRFPVVSNAVNISDNSDTNTNNFTKNKNDKKVEIQFPNTPDKLGIHNANSEAKNVRNTGISIVTYNNSMAVQNNKRIITDTVRKSTILENTTIKPALPKFFCKNNSRGRFADRNNCRRFYICVGNLIPVLGLCPQNTVFSELRKQCTNNFSHCIRNNQLKCLKEGRFSDVWHENIYYICIKIGNQKFVSFKFQCQNGYRLDKKNVTCNKILTTVKSVPSSSSTSSTDEDIKTTEKSSNKMINLEQNIQSNTKRFKCESEGKFADPTNCKRYYICSKTSKSELRRKRKKCDSDEIFDDDKNKCVDKDSHECK